MLRETQVRVANYRQSKGPLTLTLTLPLVTPATNSMRPGFVRIINNSNRAGEVHITAIDDYGNSFGPISLSLEPRAAAHFNSEELENGNPDKGLSGGVGSGRGDWRLELTTDLEIEHLAYIRTEDGFVTNMHEVAAETEAGSNRYHVPFLNPGSNTAQVSKLRLINPGSGGASIEITGVDDDGRTLGSVSLDLDAGMARILTASELESGESPHTQLTGGLGDGTGKWRLSVSADRPIQVMSLLQLPSGHLTNLSRGQDGVTVPPPPPPPPNKPDLVVESPLVDDSTLSPGQFFLFSATVRNQGGAQAAATHLHVYRSTDATISRSDTRVNSAEVSAIPASGATDSGITLTAPSAAGAYYYGACVDAVTGETNTENNCSTAVPVAVQAPVSYWGAIATGWDGQVCASSFYWFGSTNDRDRNTAVTNVLSRCRNAGRLGCTERVAFEQCGSLALGGGQGDCGLYGGSGATRDAAERNALSACGARYGNCRIPESTIGNVGSKPSYCNLGAGPASAPEVQSGGQASNSPIGVGNLETNPQARPAARRSGDGREARSVASRRQCRSVACSKRECPVETRALPSRKLAIPLAAADPGPRCPPSAPA